MVKRLLLVLVLVLLAAPSALALDRVIVNSADWHEGLRAFSEKRKPRFTGT